jgi:hypothetical protein
MNSEVLASDPIAKIQTIFHPTNDVNGGYVLEERQDVTDLVETNKAVYNSIDQRAKHDTMNRYASIPLNLFFEQWGKGMWRGNKLGQEEKRWLNDNENRFFRTRPGRV